MRKLARAVALGVVMVVAMVGVPATAAFAAPGTITTPASTPFNVAGNLAGVPQSFTIQATGFATNANVKVEICDGLPADDPQWNVTQDCDLGSQTAGQSSPGTGSTLTFTAGDVNFGIKPFNRQSTGADLNGKSPQTLFTCLSVADWPVGSNGTTDGVTGLPAWDNCQIRVASSASDQVFSTMHLPEPSTASCGAGEFPATFAAQSGLKVDCNSDPLDNVGRLVVHDATNADWHHGAARTFVDSAATFSSGGTSTVPVFTFNLASVGQITTADIGRPVSGVNGSNTEVIPGGAFITAVSGTTVTIDGSAATSSTTGFTSTVSGPITVTVEYTRNRWLTDAICHSTNPGNELAKYVDTVPGKTLTVAAGDVGKTISAIETQGTIAASAAFSGIPTAGTINVLDNVSVNHALHYTGISGGTTFTGITGTADATHTVKTGTNQITYVSSTITEIESGADHLFTTIGPKMPQLSSAAGNFTVTINGGTGTQTLGYTTVTTSAPFSINAVTGGTGTNTITAGATITWTTAKASAVTGNLFFSPSSATNNGFQALSAFLPGPAVIETSAGLTDGTLTIGTTSLPNTVVTGSIAATANSTIKQGYRIIEGSTPNTTLNSPSAGFTSADLGKSVSGGPFGPGTFISAINSTTQVTLATEDGSPPVPAECSANNGGNPNSPHPLQQVGASASKADLIEVGTATFNTTGVHEPKLFPGTDPMSVELANNTAASGGTAFTCTGSGDLTLTAGALALYPGFTGNEAGLPISITSVTNVTLSGTITSTTGANVAHTTLGACPSGGVVPTSSTVASAFIGGPSAGGPSSGDAMMTLAAEINLNPALVPTQDDCQPGGNPAKATFEGFDVVGGWTPPGTGYASNAASPMVTVGQVIFPTSVISFNGFVVPESTGADAAFGVKPHYNFDFPVLPTSLAVCLNDTVANGGVPTDATQLAFTMNATTMSKAPFLPTGSGNTGDPSVRRLLPVTTAYAAANSSIFGSAFHQTVDLKTPSGAAVGAGTFTGANCTITDPTVLSAIDLNTCGDG